jgi:predicted RND superfamily exporter protein
MLLNEDVFASLITPDNQRVRMTVATPTRPTESMLAFTDKLEQRAHRVLEGTGLTVEVTGLPALFAQVVRHLVSDAMKSFGLAVLLIWLALIAGFRSVKLATVSMLPNVLPVGLTFASMVVLGLSFDTNSAFIACMGLGIAVDYTVHIVTRYQRAKSHGAPSPRAALHYALTNAGHPVVMTSLMLMVGFAVLCLSSFAPTFRVGLLSMVLVVVALAFDLCVFPALLIVADRVGEFRSETRARPSSISGYVSNLTSFLTENQAPARPESTTDEEDWKMPADIERMALPDPGSRS